MDFIHRPRRLRGTETLRAMVRETRVAKSSLIYPIFVKEGANIAEEIGAMPGQYRYSVDRLPEITDKLRSAGVDKVMLFGIPDEKDELGSGAYREDGIVQKALHKLKGDSPSLYCITDVCLCEYTSHGHCGMLHGRSVDNDSTLPILAKTALSHAQAGADMVAPSDMMDGRVGAIRSLLDQNAFTDVPIMSYSVKYSSAFYGPFRDAAGSAPAFGDRKSYQMDYHNGKEALREAALDLDEGADILMVKPALSYLDIISRVSSAFPTPLAAYSVSGEYSMIKAAAAAGYVDESAMICETTAAIFRAGASMLITYYAPEIAGLIDQGRIG